MDTLIVLSADEKYFPLAKGLILSLLEGCVRARDCDIAFVDIGCSGQSIAWLSGMGVRVGLPDAASMGDLADKRLGYHRAQTCRPFLPELFPGPKNYIWLDCDTWVQNVLAIEILRSAANSHPGRIALCPESHYSYTVVNENTAARRAELYSYYAPLYGEAVASYMADRTMLNSGVFALCADSSLWDEWKCEVHALFTRRYAHSNTGVLHFAEQMALNVVLAKRNDAVLVDPLLNYICCWTPPLVDDLGVVRVPLLPHSPVSIVHLCGGWSRFGKRYLESGLLYRRGDYLTKDDLAILALIADDNRSTPALENHELREFSVSP